MGLLEAVDRQKLAFRQAVKDAIAESHALGLSVSICDESGKRWSLHPDGSRTEISMIVPADFESLALLCWNRDKAQPIDRETAWALYRENWRLVWQDTLSADEIALIESLTAEFGDGETLLGTDGPPPSWARRFPERFSE